MDQVRRYDGLELVNRHGDLYFSLHDFVIQVIPFKFEKF